MSVVSEVDSSRSGNARGPHELMYFSVESKTWPLRLVTLPLGGASTSAQLNWVWVPAVCAGPPTHCLVGTGGVAVENVPPQPAAPVALSWVNGSQFESQRPVLAVSPSLAKVSEKRLHEKPVGHGRSVPVRLQIGVQVPLAASVVASLEQKLSRAQLSKPVVMPEAPKVHAPPVATVPTGAQPMTPSADGVVWTRIQVHLSPVGQPVCRLTLQAAMTVESIPPAASMVTMCGPSIVVGELPPPHAARSPMNTPKTSFFICELLYP